MSPRLRFTERDQATVDATVRKVRLLGLRQIAEHWWDGDLANARRRLGLLVDADLLKRITGARAITPCNRPSGRALATNSSRTCLRSGLPSTSGTLATASRKGANMHTSRRLEPAKLFGGKTRGELKNPLQATHDLGVAAVWLHFDAHEPELADAWQGEDLMAHTRRGEKCPDAFIVDEAGEVTCVVEFGGAYDAERVRAFHHDCASRGLAYQIW